MKSEQKEIIETTLIAVEQYVTTLLSTIFHPSIPFEALDAARNNLIEKVDAFVKEINK